MTTWGHYCDFLRAKGFVEEVMIVSAQDGSNWASSPESFVLREYKATIVQEDGTDKEETVNEASNVVSFIQGSTPAQGLRLNGSKKHQIIRNFKDDKTGGAVIYAKVPQGGACVADGGRCIVIGTFSEAKNQTSADANDLIMLMARYLKESSWPDGINEGDVDKSSGGAKTWQPFIDAMLVGKGNVAEALICSRSEGKVWASTKGFGLQSYEAEVMQEDGSEKMMPIDEAKALVTLMNSQAGFRPPGCIRINSTKFQFLKGFDDDHALTVLGKKTRGGCCIVATKQVVVCAVFDEGVNHTAAGCNLCCADLAKYLGTLGY